MRRRWFEIIVFGFFALLFAGSTALAAQTDTTKKVFRLGYFEGGYYKGHYELREEFLRQLTALMSDEYEVVFAPEGYRSAGWKRDSCRLMAEELTRVKSIDLMVAMGPWVVKDLLDAGYTKPILAMYQFDPVLQGLVDSTGKPIATNLTVQVKPNLYEKDLQMFSDLFPIKRLGVLFFPPDTGKETALARLDSLGKQFGIDVVTAEGYDKYGTYAFFKAYRSLDKKIDALYLLPLWGMSNIKIVEFFRMVTNDKIPTLTSEPKFLIEQGALASASAYSIVSDARYNADKAKRILLGEQPDQLSTSFQGGLALALNEHAVQKCELTLPTEALDEAYLVEAPLPEEAAFYTFPQAIERALSFNPAYVARGKSLDAAIAAAKQAYSSYLPHLVGTASLTHFDDNTIANSGGRLQPERYQVGVELYQKIFSLQAIKAIQIAAQQKRQENLSVRQFKLDLELAVAAAYLQYLYAQDLLATELRYRDLVDYNIEMTGTINLLEPDEAHEIDLLRWRDERDQVTTRVINAKNQRDAAVVLLNVLFNLPGESPLSVDTSLFCEKSFWKDYQNFETLASRYATDETWQDVLVKNALEINPTLQSIEVEKEIQKSRLSQNTARFLPELDFRAAWNYVDQRKDLPPLFEEKHSTWFLWGGVTLPLFLGFERTNERAKLRAQLDRVAFEKDAAALELMGKIRRQCYDLEAKRKETMRALRSKQLAHQTLSMTIEQYEAGKRGLVDMIDAIDNAYETEIAALEARYGFYLEMARLVHDVGWSTQGADNSFRREFFTRLWKTKK